MKKLEPTSATMVFPAAHINSPASMFGHTFLRINSKHNSKLLSYAVNYAADADPKKENGFSFAIKGLFGGYYGKYSLLPYYEKLKEYRDGEQRDIWEYDLNLNEEETKIMLDHIWELNGTNSHYYFLTENCSYNMLWLIESARPSISLRKYFYFEVMPLETIHALKEEGLISQKYYRPSKRTVLLKYEKLLNSNNLIIPKKLLNGEISLQYLLDDKSIELEQKQYIFEAAIEFLEYSYKKNSMNKEDYLKLFYSLSMARANLSKGKILEFNIPPNPIESHRAIRVTSGFGFRDKEQIGFIGIRPGYHDLEDIQHGFLRGTQIEFLNLELSYSKIKNEKIFQIEEATILSIVSLAQRSEFFDSLSWRTKFGFDRDILQDNQANFLASAGFGFSWGSKIGYIYTMFDPFAYLYNGISFGIGSSIGLIIDDFSWTNINIEGTSRIYDDSKIQYLLNLSQSINLSQNLELKFKYNYKSRYIDKINQDEETFKVMLNFYF